MNEQEYQDGAIHHLSLCAGIGGIDLGLRSVVSNLRTVAMVEREAFAAASLVEKMESGELDPCPIYADLLRFPWQKYRGLVDLITGGFPCQPFSHAGRREATQDPRHLWPIIKRGISTVQPGICFFENVDGIASAKSSGFHSVLHHVLGDLESMGYRSTAGRFTAREVGAPHLRRRWFVLALAHAGRNNAPTRGKCANASTRRTERHGQKASGRDARSGHLKTTRQTSGDRWPLPPGPNQHEWEPPRTVESGVGGGSHGLPDRVDRLRALGNAVVPAVAGRAFLTLLERLQTGEGADDGTSRS